MYYREYRGGFLLPFLAGAVISPLFLGAFGNNGYYNSYPPQQSYGNQYYPYINQQFAYPYYPYM